MKGLRCITAALALLYVAATPAAAKPSYAPGTVGYLYEDCRKAAQSETADEFLRTYCASFGIGYAFGWFEANWMMLAPPKQKSNGPCAADEARIHTHIRGRVCESLTKAPAYAMKDPVVSALHIFFRWVEHLEDTGQKDTLNRPAALALNNMIAPGPYCDTINAFRGGDFPYPVSKAVRKFSRQLAQGVKARLSTPGYESCSLAAAKPGAFDGTPCGGEIAGYITGLNSTQWVQDNRKDAEDPACQPGIKRLYESLDIARHRCLPAGKEPLRVARAYLTQGEEIAATLPEKNRGTVAKTLSRLRFCARPAILTAPE